jgi:hypothetical protein
VFRLAKKSKDLSICQVYILVQRVIVLILGGVSMGRARLNFYYLLPKGDVSAFCTRALVIDKAIRALQQEYELDGRKPRLARFTGKDSISVKFIQDESVVRQALEDLVESEELVPNIVSAPGSLWGERLREENRGTDVALEVLGSGYSLNPVRYAAPFRSIRWYNVEIIQEAE